MPALTRRSFLLGGATAFDTAALRLAAAQEKPGGGPRPGASRLDPNGRMQIGRSDRCPYAACGR